MRYALIVALNILDGVATAAGLAAGLISEANPLLAGLSAGWLLAVKLLPVNFLVLVLYNTRENVLSQIGALVIVGVYTHIFVLHIFWISACLT